MKTVEELRLAIVDKLIENYKRKTSPSIQVGEHMIEAFRINLDKVLTALSVMLCNSKYENMATYIKNDSDVHLAFLLKIIEEEGLYPVKIVDPLFEFPNVGKSLDCLNSAGDTMYYIILAPNFVTYDKVPTPIDFSDEV